MYKDVGKEDRTKRKNKMISDRGGGIEGKNACSKGYIPLSCMCLSVCMCVCVCCVCSDK